MAIDIFIQTNTKQSREQLFAGGPFVIAAVICILLCGCFAVSTLLRFGQSYDIEMESRINPNEAPIASLVRLPGLGVSRAGAIAAYRKQFTREKSNRQAFEKVDDLQTVKGIGPKTAEKISQWLKFE